MSEGHHGPSPSWQSRYTVRTKTGDMRFAGTNADVHIRLFDSETASEKIKLDNFFRNDFKKGEIDHFKIGPLDVSLGPLVKIELTRNDRGVSPNWFLEYVDIQDTRTEEHYVFQVNRWVENEETILVEHLSAVLPQDDQRPAERHAELVAKRRLYEYGQYGPGYPVQVKHVPKDEEFSEDFLRDIRREIKKLISTLFITKMISQFGRFDEFKDIEKLYRKLDAADRPTGLDHWRDDAWFGLQRVMSCNPVVIKLCKRIPGKFGVTADMVEPFLEGNKLSDALMAKKIYICDLKILEGVPGNDDLKICQPRALFFVNQAGDLMPVAIQLFQKKAENNPVFYPSDDKNLWLLAKMWYNVADSNHHQAMTHLANTHMIAEGIAVCTHRNLHRSHPIFQLLAPHFLHLMAINHGAVNVLLEPDGPIDKTMAIGSSGFFKLLSEQFWELQLDVEGHLPNDLKARGVDDTDALPFYPYRDDALLLWNAIHKYVQNIVNLFYDTDAKIQGDTELQKWAKELTAPVKKGGIGMKGVPGNGMFGNPAHLVEALTCIIFKCSVRHAAVNFSQYDAYAFTPNYPNHLNGDPPTDKNPRTEKELVDALPTKKRTKQIIGVATLLSTKGTKPLGDFEVQYLYGSKADAITKAFRQKLVEISKIIAERNSLRKHRYDYLDPGFIPNSISI